MAVKKKFSHILPGEQRREIDDRRQVYSSTSASPRQEEEE
jgi:hypothetical protein